MNLSLQDKIIIVTGGAKGIGESIVRGVAEEGGIPVIVGRSKEAGERLAQELQEAGKESMAIYKELALVENCEFAIEQTYEKYKRIDALINNAGRNDGIGLETGHPDAFIYSIQSNLYHYYNMAHFALPYLKESKGNILNICSKEAFTGKGRSSAYAASKGGQLALTREWAVELAKYQVRVNAIVPSEVMTPLYQRWLDTFENPEEQLQMIENKIPLGKRLTTPTEIANTALFLISERASHMTGQFIFIDGGYVHLDRAI